MPHDIPRQHFRGSTIQKPGKLVKRLDRLGINFAHIMQVNLGMDTRTNWPHETPGEHFDTGLSRGNVLGSTFHIEILLNIFTHLGEYIQ